MIVLVILVVSVILLPVANLFLEAAVVGAVCLVFLILFIVSGIKQIYSDKNDS